MHISKIVQLSMILIGYCRGFVTEWIAYVEREELQVQLR